MLGLPSAESRIEVEPRFLHNATVIVARSCDALVSEVQVQII